MLTRADQTVTDGLDVLDDIRPLGLTHIGFKDVGGPPATLAALSRRIREMVATSYLEVVSTSPASILLSARVARDICSRSMGRKHLALTSKPRSGSTLDAAR